jgi:hypothetical protein
MQPDLVAGIEAAFNAVTPVQHMPSQVLLLSKDQRASSASQRIPFIVANQLEEALFPVRPLKMLPQLAYVSKFLLTEPAYHVVHWRTAPTTCFVDVAIELLGKLRVGYLLPDNVHVCHHVEAFDFLLL